jgi:phenylpropionate dioxygenase-like ring-hydroxylating dioxygenase large terminal subunit
MGAIIRFRELNKERNLRRGAAKGMTSAQPRATKRLGELLEEVGHESVTDARLLIPTEGLREYWYPALPSKKVPRRKPLFWRMLSDDVALFRGADGEVKAIADACPHRGASMAAGSCFYEGTVSCPYHGATFDGDGECVAFLTEGPDSKMQGSLHVRTYPTRTLRGWVFIWMGDSKPAPIEQDVPPEFFDDRKSTVVMSTYTYWKTNWLVALENQGDSHNAGLFAHRNSVMQLSSKYFTRARSPYGPRAKIVNDRAVVATMTFQGGHYADENGKSPFQLYYPGVDGNWPVTTRRQKVWTILQPWYSLVGRSEWRRNMCTTYELEEEWGGNVPGPGGHHLPCAVRINLAPYWVFSRNAVPIGANESRLVYFHTRTIKTPIMRFLFKIWFHGYLNWWYHYNFSAQDNAVAGPSRYFTEENLSATDSQLVVLRKLITDHSRDAKIAHVAIAARDERQRVSIKGA